MIESDSLRRLAAALGIKATSSGIHGAISDMADAFEKGQVNLGGDWNTMKNRPFYSKTDYIVPETKLTNIDPEDSITGIEGVDFSLTLGGTYVVTWNGTDYKCTAKAAVEDGFVLGTAVGNMQLMGSEDTGEPFLIVAIFPENVAAIGVSNFVFLMDGSTEATVSIKGETIEKLDNKYLDLEWIPATKTEIVAELIAEQVPKSGGLLEQPDYSLLSPDNNMWLVTIDGKEYIREATVEGNLNEGGDRAYISMKCGNPALMGTGAADNGDSFIVAVTYCPNYPAENMSVVLFADGSNDHTISVHILKEETEPIPDKFLSVFNLNFTVNPTDFSITADKTPAEARQAFDEGKEIKAKVYYTGGVLAMTNVSVSQSTYDNALFFNGYGGNATFNTTQGTISSINFAVVRGDVQNDKWILAITQIPTST